MPRDLHSLRYHRLREILVEYRKQSGLTQTALAKKLSRPQSFVADIERAERRVDVIDYLSIAVAIGFDPIAGIRDLLVIPDEDALSEKTPDRNT